MTVSIFDTDLHGKVTKVEPYHGRIGIRAAVTGAGWITARSRIIVNFPNPFTPDGVFRRYCRRQSWKLPVEDERSQNARGQHFRHGRLAKEVVMVRKYYGLPPLITLAVFEATARHSSFKRAAEEMNVTTSAISRQIKALEDEVGIKLFLREKNGVQLTPPGQDLFAALAASFSRCADAIRAIKSDTRIESVTFACTDTFATHWLMPRMPDFWNRHPEITVNHLVSDQVRDFRNAEVDLFVRASSGAWPNETTQQLFDDVIYPVCGRAFFERHPNVTPPDLSRMPLLHMDWTNPDWPLWQDFLQASSIPYEGLRGKRFGKYAVLLLAAEADQGVALGWHSLVSALVEQGKLVRLTSLSMRDPVGFRLAWNEKRPLSPAAVLFKEWLLVQAESWAKKACLTEAFACRELKSR